VGITCQRPEHRWNNGEGYRKSPHFYCAILKYGWENIRHEILFENLTFDEASQKEIELIGRYKTNNRKYGYNLSSGGESGFAGCSWSEERKRLVSQLRIGNKYSLGYKHTDETRKRMSEAQLRRERKPLTEEQKAVCIANLPSPQRGANNPMARPVLCVELQTVYSCGKEAAEALGLQRAHISGVCRGKRATTGGYHFRFLEG
jgi:group I intron endonuclease